MSLISMSSARDGGPVVPGSNVEGLRLHGCIVRVEGVLGLAVDRQGCTIQEGKLKRSGLVRSRSQRASRSATSSGYVGTGVLLCLSDLVPLQECCTLQGQSLADSRRAV